MITKDHRCMCSLEFNSNLYSELHIATNVLSILFLHYCITICVVILLVYMLCMYVCIQSSSYIATYVHNYVQYFSLSKWQKKHHIPRQLNVVHSYHILDVLFFVVCIYGVVLFWAKLVSQKTKVKTTIKIGYFYFQNDVTFNSCSIFRLVSYVYDTQLQVVICCHLLKLRTQQLCSYTYICMCHTAHR